MDSHCAVTLLGFDHQSWAWSLSSCWHIVRQLLSTHHIFDSNHSQNATIATCYYQIWHACGVNLSIRVSLEHFHVDARFTNVSKTKNHIEVTPPLLWENLCHDMHMLSFFTIFGFFSLSSNPQCQLSLWISAIVSIQLRASHATKGNIYRGYPCSQPLWLSWNVSH